MRLFKLTTAEGIVLVQTDYKRFNKRFYEILKDKLAESQGKEEWRQVESEQVNNHLLELDKVENRGDFYRVYAGNASLVVKEFIDRIKVLKA